ncbi:MAG TPA: FtsX-like permease family protein, partial [Aggregatilineaceae bacterium]|nr:FtsX-like permease family protein [Aggregatilineaceae bacterium]
DPATANEVRTYIVSEGRFLQPGDDEVAVIPGGLVDLAPQIKVGTKIPLVTATGLKMIPIVGILAEKGDPAAPEVLVPLADAQEWLDQPGLINTINVNFETGADADQVKADIQQALGSDYTFDNESSGLDSLAALGVGTAMLNVMAALALFIGAFLIFNTFRTVIIERRRDLGMLRAIGASRRQLSRMILIESLIQGIMGVVIGLISGYLLALLIMEGMAQLMSKFMAVSTLRLHFNATAFVSATAAGLITTLLAGYWPARAAGRISPIEALRPVAPADARRNTRRGLIIGVIIMLLASVLLVSNDQTTGPGAVLFMIGAIAAMPALVVPITRRLSPLLTLWFNREGDLARGNLTRQTGRAAITASTLMIGLAVLILIAAMVLSFDDLVTELTERSFASDIILMPQTIALYQGVVGADENLLTELRDLPDVETATGLRAASSLTDGKTIEVLGIDPARYSQVSEMKFAEGDITSSIGELAQGRNVIINSITGAAFDLGMGDDIVLETATGPQTYHVVGVADDLLHFKINAAFISQENLKADFHKAEDVLIMLNLKPGADHHAVLARVEDILKDYPQFTARITGEYREEMAKTMDQAFILYYGMAFLILIPSALGLLNTLTINVLERTREIGVIRAVGGSRGQIRRIVMAEALLLGLLGAAVGIVVGVAISYGSIGAFSVVGWKMTYTFPIVGVIVSVVVGVLLALVASILPARNAAKLDIIRALQYE